MIGPARINTIPKPPIAVSSSLRHAAGCRKIMGSFQEGADRPPPTIPTPKVSPRGHFGESHNCASAQRNTMYHRSCFLFLTIKIYFYRREKSLSSHLILFSKKESTQYQEKRHRKIICWLASLSNELCNPRLPWMVEQLVRKAFPRCTKFR